MMNLNKTMTTMGVAAAIGLLAACSSENADNPIAENTPSMEEVKDSTQENLNAARENVEETLQDTKEAAAEAAEDFGDWADDQISSIRADLAKAESNTKNWMEKPEIKAKIEAAKAKMKVLEDQMDKLADQSGDTLQDMKDAIEKQLKTLNAEVKELTAS